MFNINPLEEAIALPYLGRTITYNNSDWENLCINLQKYKRLWGMVEKVMGVTGAPIKAWAMIYKALVQTVLLYGSEIWLVTDSMMIVIEGYHHKIARRQG